MSIWKSQNGFTLAELLVALAGVGLLLGAVLGIQMTGLQAYVTGSSRLEVQQNGRVALERTAREIRQASAITAAGVGSITFTAQDGVTAVTYSLDAETGELQRNGVAIVGGVEALTFVYRNASGTTGATAANTRRIDITIRTGTEEDVAAGSAGDAKYQTKTSVQLRNIL